MNEDLVINPTQKIVTTEPGIRKVFVLREVQINFLDIKKGNIFRLEDTPVRNLGRDGYLYDMAEEDAKGGLPDCPEGVVQCHEIAVINASTITPLTPINFRG